jgi:hypothetical protein
MQESDDEELVDTRLRRNPRDPGKTQQFSKTVKLWISTSVSSDNIISSGQVCELRQSLGLQSRALILELKP